MVIAAPGDLDQRTGGYLYDRHLADAMEAQGWAVERLSLPDPGRAADVDAVLSAIEDGSLVLIDGLALGRIPALAARHAARLRLVGLVHHPLFRESGLTIEQARALRCSEAEALRHVRAVICTSPTTARELPEELEVDPALITVAVPGVGRASPAAGGGGAPQLLYVATVTRRKAHRLLVEALHEVVDLDWSLICVGSLEREPATVSELRDAIASLGLGRRITLAGEMDEPALAEAYGAADLVVSSSLYEGYGMALAEALARGLPIVAAAGGAVAETVPAEAGMLVPPGDVAALASALRDVLSDTALRQRLRAGALRARDRLPTWSDTAAVVADALERLV